ncbi:hypothetical protein E2562_038887 [Oryza meyeriana var. granulata]|uniref:Uncharacterized protein n=2 Tax=Oryza meyeriana var. granulata TaxID=110450 RepID=A0A6G1EUC3_9ORYZ|nr:hypothetical protein E2562_038887 [Oryza meyeriana var. granulata]
MRLLDGEKGGVGALLRGEDPRRRGGDPRAEESLGGGSALQYRGYCSPAVLRGLAAAEEDEDRWALIPDVMHLCFSSYFLVSLKLRTG